MPAFCQISSHLVFFSIWAFSPWRGCWGGEGGDTGEIRGRSPAINKQAKTNNWLPRRPAVTCFLFLMRIGIFCQCLNFQKYFNDFLLWEILLTSLPPYTTVSIPLCSHTFSPFYVVSSWFQCNSEFYFPSALATEYYCISYPFLSQLASSVKCSAGQPCRWVSMPKFPLGEILSYFNWFWVCSFFNSKLWSWRSVRCIGLSWPCPNFMA